MKPLQVRRTGQRLLPNANRVLAKPFLPGDEILLNGSSRAQVLVARILRIPESHLAQLNAEVCERFEARHRGFQAMLERHYEMVAEFIDNPGAISEARRLLIGAYFTNEYSVEAAALFNPSIVASPDQSGLASDALRIVMSARAVGEGHLSSIEFRSGVIDGDANLMFDPVGTQVEGGVRTDPAAFDKTKFSRKLLEMGAINDLSSSVLGRLGDRFTADDLETLLKALETQALPHAMWFETATSMRRLACSNYVTTFATGTEIAERVLFPSAPNETRGMEDARFVRFTDADGSIKYCATYTAYDGFNVMPQLIETQDFRTFTISTLNGVAAQNKGMALFPRRIDGKFVMLSRMDRENLHLSVSHDLHHWDDVTGLATPRQPWELIQIGNCGSPIETAAGWLVLTHGVGPMRRYAIGAMLLALDDPTKVIGHLSTPLLEPTSEEREGYVPNVVYTCGAIVHAGQLIMPYGFSDAGIAVAQVTLDDLLETLLAAHSTPAQKSVKSP